MIVDVGGVEAFAVAARRLGDSARAAGLAVPAFRSPPRVAGAVRTIRRYPGGTVVSVQLRDRSHEAVAADMVEGVVITNRLTGDAALRARTLLSESITGLGTADAAPAPSSPVLAERHAA
jgi:hypothetical protein